MPETTVAQEKLIEYLNEAYGLEQRLETSLQAHIAMTTHGGYKKRLKEHLTETKRHGRDVKKRIKQLGGVAATVDAPGPSQVGEVAQAVLSGAQKAAALAQGPLHALRGHQPSGEASEERQDRVRERGGGDRDVQLDRGARAGARRSGYAAARTRDQARGGAHALLPRERDPAFHEGCRPSRDPGVAASRHSSCEKSFHARQESGEPKTGEQKSDRRDKTLAVGQKSVVADSIDADESSSRSHSVRSVCQSERKRR